MSNLKEIEENVYLKGKQYGIVNKEVLDNKKLSVRAKALYVYLCARSGNKGKCHPLVDTICRDLSIKPSTFHKMKKELINNHIIDVAKIGAGSNKRNNYILKTKQGRRSYGIVLLDIITDSSIPLKAKAIYGLLSCLSGTRFIAFPTVEAICKTLKISRTTYYACIKSLKEKKYVITKQLHVNGRYSHCNFYINNNEPPADEVSGKYIFQSGKEAHDNLNVTSKNITSNNKAQIQKSPEYMECEHMVSLNIEYDTLKAIYHENKKALYLLDNILSVLVSNIFAKDVKDIMYRGVAFGNDIIKSIYNKLNFDNVRYAIDGILRSNTKIHNIRSYIKVVLLSSYNQVAKQQHYNLR